jgi:hypothetical protein
MAVAVAPRHLEQSTPSSTRRRWQGTRTSFVELVSALERCMQTVGLMGITLNVTIGDHEGVLVSPQALRDELTEELWLSSRKIRVILSPSDGDTWMSLTLEGPELVLFVSYHGGTPQSRETLRVVVERALPERPNPRRHFRWVGPLFGIAYSATLLLIASRFPWHWSIRTGWSQTVIDGVRALDFIFNAVFGMIWPWLAFRFWFPSLERLPDKAESRWDRWRGWVQVAIGLWVTFVIGLLALHATT